jgi:hypothetical protein
VLSDEARLVQRADWRKLAIAFGLALAVVAVTLGARWIAG